jgi:carboxypeptidase Q
MSPASAPRHATPRGLGSGRVSGYGLGLGVALLGCARAQPSPSERAPDHALEARPEPNAGSTPPAADAIADELAAIGADPVIRAIVEQAATSEVDEHLRALAVDIGPRLTGSTSLHAAETWAIARFEAWGLDARREVWGSLPVGFERGAAKGSVIRPERSELEFTTWAWTPGTRGPSGSRGRAGTRNQAQVLEAGGPVRGQALRYPSGADQLRELEPYLRDAWILVPWGFDPGELDPTERRQIELAFARAPIAGLVWAAGDADERRIHTRGEHRVDPAALPQRVEVRVRGDQHAQLLAQLDAGVYVELEFAVANRWLPGPVEAANVIAELRGREWPEQRIIIGAHLDSWDGASGALDNATGVATTLEAARLIAAACAKLGVGPRRTLSFMLWSGAEQGQLGSQAWVAAHPDQLAGIRAVLVHDHGTNYISGLAVTPAIAAIMSQVVAPIHAVAPSSMPFALREVEALPRTSTDADAFLAAGIPSMLWDQAGRSDYDHYHHTQHDHADAVIDSYQRHSALVIAIAAWTLANLEHENLHDPHQHHE